MYRVRRHGVVVLFFALALIAGGCAPSPSFLQPASSIARNQADLYKIILAMAFVVFVLVEAALILILIRDRRRHDDKGIPPQLFGNMGLEIVWTVIPILLTVVLFVMMLQTMRAVAAPSPSSSDVNVHIVGHRWWWEYEYTDYGFKTANELHIPAGANVQVTLDSVDVIHSFWVPQLSGKTDAIPGQTNHMWLTADEPGVYRGQCAEFCGLEHALMRLKVVVDSPQDFDAWVANQQLPAPEPQTEQEMAGLETLNGVCATCHSLDPGETKALAGPNLTHLFSRTSFAGATYDLTEANLRSWLADPDAMKPGNDMVVKVAPKTIDDVIAYLKLLK
jgi:cytochrome c oxidase subunit 2